MSESKSARVSVVVPVYNEADGLAAFGAKLAALARDKGEALEIVWVDDGSTDGSSELLEGLGLGKVLRHETRLGYGAALKTGLRAVTGERVLFLDADGQHEPADAWSLLARLDDHDLVIGARKSLGTVPRRCALAVLNRVASILADRPIPDLTSGLRAYRRDRLLEFEHLFPNGFSASATGTLAFAVSGCRILFVPIEARPRSSGSSKIRPVQDAISFLILIFRAVFLFGPLKFLVPAAGSFFLLGVVWTAKTLYFTHSTSPLGMALFLASLLTLLFGLLAEQVACLQRGLGRIIVETRARESARG